LQDFLYCEHLEGSYLGRAFIRKAYLSKAWANRNSKEVDLMRIFSLTELLITTRAKVYPWSWNIRSGYSFVLINHLNFIRATANIRGLVNVPSYLGLETVYRYVHCFIIHK